MAEREPVHPGLATRSSGWRAWIVFLALVLAGATAVAAICHEEHAADQDCAVCQLRHQPAAEPSGFLQIGFADVPEPLEPVVAGGWIASGHFRRLPARAPPA
ncbi:MAG: hypothetical protein OXG04_17075 [Acidobacteria bacterium]|nr:hypothetical protein [Acidobacteriota bacterium]